MAKEMGLDPAALTPAQLAELVTKAAKKQFTVAMIEKASDAAQPPATVRKK
jgi:hypothetical protein